MISESAAGPNAPKSEETRAEWRGRTEAQSSRSQGGTFRGGPMARKARPSSKMTEAQKPEVATSAGFRVRQGPSGARGRRGEETLAERGKATNAANWTRSSVKRQPNEMQPWPPSAPPSWPRCPRASVQRSRPSLIAPIACRSQSQGQGQRAAGAAIVRRQGLQVVTKTWPRTASSSPKMTVASGARACRIKAGECVHVRLRRGDGSTHGIVCRE